MSVIWAVLSTLSIGLGEFFAGVGSQFAAVAVVLGLIFRNERLWWWQGVGLVGASMAVALISLG